MLPKQRNLDGVADSVNEILTQEYMFGNLNMLNVRWTAGEPIFGVYPSLTVGNLLFRTRQLISSAQRRSIVLCRISIGEYAILLWDGNRVRISVFCAAFFLEAAFFCFGGER